MKVLVPIKRVVDYNVKIRPKADGTGVDIANAKMSMNPFCEIAVEEAVRLKESGIVSEVVVVSVGLGKSQDQIRSAMAIGADRGILVETGLDLSPLAVAKILNVIYGKESPGLVICGRQSIDGDNGQTGQMFAALAGLPQGTFASSLKVDADSVVVTREVDGGLQSVRLKLPAVVTTDLRLNEPRYASLPDIMKAKKKPIDLISLETLGLDLSDRLKVLNVAPPPERQGGIKVDSVETLLDKLKNEAKVI